MRGRFEKPSVYLAGAIHNHPDDGKYWRQVIEAEYEEVDWINSLPYTTPIAIHPGQEGMSSSEIVSECKELIDEADAVLVNHMRKVSSPGTWREVEYAIERNIPVVVMVDDTDDVSPFLEDGAEALVESMEAGVQMVENAACENAYSGPPEDPRTRMKG